MTASSTTRIGTATPMALQLTRSLRSTQHHRLTLSLVPNASINLTVAVLVAKMTIAFARMQKGERVMYKDDETRRVLYEVLLEQCFERMPEEEKAKWIRKERSE